MDRLRAMQTFVRIAEAGSLTAAARELDSSLPAVVRTLAAYEAHLGVRLFHRTTRRVTLTDEGTGHLERVREVLTALDDAEAALGTQAAAPAGHLRITAPVLFGQMYVAPAVTRFVQRHAGLHCTLVLLDRITNLLEEGLDAGVRIGHLEDASLVAWPLGEVRRVVVGTPAFLRQHGVPAHPRDLRHFDCVRVLGHRSGWGDFQESGRTFQVPVSGSLAFNHVWPAVQACAAGAGLGMFFSYQVEPLLAAGRLRVVLERFERPARPIQIVAPSARLLPARTRAFIDFIRQDITRFRARPA